MKIRASLKPVVTQLLARSLLGCLTMVGVGCGSVDARKAEFLQRGQTYYNENNYDKARIELRNALQIDPKFVEARYLSGRIAEKRSDIRDAVGQYQAAVDTNPKYELARAALARIYMLAGVLDKARELVDAGLKDEPQNAALLTVRGALEVQAGHLPAALEDAEAAIKIAPNDEYTISLLASLYKQSSRLDKAIAVVSDGIKQLPTSVDLRVVLADLEATQQDFVGVETQLKQIITLDPKNIANRSRLVQFYLYRKDPAGAETTWRQTIADMPDRVEPKLALVYLLWAQRGEETATSEMQAMVNHEPDNAELQLAMGSYLERQNKVERAEQIYQQVIKKESKEAKGLRARNQLAALYLKRNDSKLSDNQRAQSLVAEVLKESPRDNDALILRANMALQRGDAATAITDLRSVLRDQPNATPLMRALAKAHLQNNEPSLAEETLRSALQANPGDVPTRKELAQLLIQHGKSDQARPLLEQLATSQGANVEMDVLDGLFKTQVLAKDYAAAQHTAEQVQQLQPKLAVGWYFAALVADAQQHRDAARKNYEHALELQPDVAEPLAALVRMDVFDKQNKRAMERLDKGIAINSGNAVAHNLRGELLLADKQWQSAAAEFNHAIMAASQWVPPYRNLAMAQLQQKQSDEAIATYQAGIEKTHDAALITELATIHERMGKPDEAIKVYEQWLARDPKALLAANNLAMLLLNYHGSDQASVGRTTKLADVLTSSTESALLDTRGWIKYKNGDYQGAVNLLQQALNGHTDSASIRYHLGMAQLRVGNTAAARDNLQTALATGQGFFGVDEAKSALSKLGQAG